MKNYILEKAVEKYKKGDKTAFNTIYDLSYKLVFFIALDIVKDKGVAEDIVQETYIKVFKEIDRYEANNFTAWIGSIARNLSINEYNKRKRENTFEDIDVLNNIENTHDFTENLDLFQIAREVLSEEDYKIVILCVISGYKRREVSKILDMPVSTVSFRLKTALNTIKERLEGGRK